MAIIVIALIIVFGFYIVKNAPEFDEKLLYDKDSTVIYDKNGEFAAKGNIDEEFLDYLLQDKYYSLPPPKTTGREYFSIIY